MLSTETASVKSQIKKMPDADLLANQKTEKVQMPPLRHILASLLLQAQACGFAAPYKSLNDFASQRPVKSLTASHA